MEFHTPYLPRRKIPPSDQRADALHCDEQDACMFLNLRFSDPGGAEVAVRQLTAVGEENDEVQSNSSNRGIFPLDPKLCRAFC